MQCNVGIHPKYLPDQILLAEYRELPIVVGSLRRNGWQIKSNVPERFGLGPGHVNFFKLRLIYLSERHYAVKKECARRGFNCIVLTMDPLLYPEEFRHRWEPTMDDSMVIRKRVIERMTAKPFNYWRQYSIVLDVYEMAIAINNIRNGELFFV